MGSLEEKKSRAASPSGSYKDKNNAKHKRKRTEEGKQSTGMEERAMRDSVAEGRRRSCKHEVRGSLEEKKSRAASPPGS